MRKPFYLIGFILLILLVGCSTKSSKEPKSDTLSKNAEVWNKKVKKAKNIDNSNFDKKEAMIPDGYKDEDMSLSRLKKGNQNLIVGQVVNLQPEYGRLEVETKASVYVKKVIKGNKKLQGKIIKTEFSGGLTKAKYYFSTFEGEFNGKDFGVPDQNTIVYSTNVNVPMPQIGNEIIIGLKKYHPENKYREKMYRKHGLTTKNFYVINNPQVTFWVKAKKKYELNNPAFLKVDNKFRVKNIVKLTKELNNRY